MMRVCPKCGSFYTENYKGDFCMADGHRLVPCKQEPLNDDLSVEPEEQFVSEEMSDGAVGHNHKKILSFDPQCKIYNGLFEGERIVADEEGLYLEQQFSRGARLNSRNVDAFRDVTPEVSDQYCVLIRWREGECSYASLDDARMELLRRDCEEDVNLEPTIPYYKKGGLSSGAELLLIIGGLIISIWLGTMLTGNIFLGGCVGLVLCGFYVVILQTLDEANINANKRHLREAYMFEDDIVVREEQEKKEKQRREEQARAQEIQDKENREKLVKNNLKCPICGSHDVERISTGSRVASVAMVGLASGKIGKQYRCKDCKHMW